MPGPSPSIMTSHTPVYPLLFQDRGSVKFFDHRRRVVGGVRLSAHVVRMRDTLMDIDEYL